MEDPAYEVEEETGEIIGTAPSVLDEKVIPEAYPGTRYQNTWKTNPFLKITTRTAAPTKNWTEDWALSSMFKSETGKISIGLQNKQTGDFKRVTNEDGPNSEFRLVQANFNRNRNEASVEIEKGNVRGTLKYDENLTSKPVTINQTFKAPTAPPGVNPNARPGQPGQPVNVAQPGLQGLPSSGLPPRPGVAPAVSPQSPASPPTISRRRNLIPVPPAPPPQPPSPPQ
ncbi:hypothetical protein WJU23_05925 [Prosthecobacter sp. SYSU 5D2]